MVTIKALDKGVPRLDPEQGLVVLSKVGPTLTILRFQMCMGDSHNIHKAL